MYYEPRTSMWQFECIALYVCYNGTRSFGALTAGAEPTIRFKMQPSGKGRNNKHHSSNTYLATLDLEALDAGTCHSPPGSLCRFARQAIALLGIGLGSVVVTREAFPGALEFDTVNQGSRMGFCVPKEFPHRARAQKRF